MYSCHNVYESLLKKLLKVGNFSQETLLCLLRWTCNFVQFWTFKKSLRHDSQWLITKTSKMLMKTSNGWDFWFFVKKVIKFFNCCCFFKIVNFNKFYKIHKTKLPRNSIEKLKKKCLFYIKTFIQSKYAQCSVEKLILWIHELKNRFCFVCWNFEKFLSLKNRKIC